MTRQRTKPGAVVIIVIEIFKIYTGWNKVNPYGHLSPYDRSTDKPHAFAEVIHTSIGCINALSAPFCQNVILKHWVLVILEFRRNVITRFWLTDKISVT